MSRRFFRLLILITVALALPLCVWLVMPRPGTRPKHTKAWSGRWLT